MTTESEHDPKMDPTMTAPASVAEVRITRDTLMHMLREVIGEQAAQAARIEQIAKMLESR